MPFIKDQDVIQAVAPERPDQPFNIWVLPGRPWRDRTVPNPHRPQSTCEGLPVGAIIVAHQIGWRYRIPRMPPRSAAPATLPSGAGSLQTRVAVVDRDPRRTMQTGTRMSGLEPRIDRLPQWRPHGYAGMSARSAMAALSAGSRIWRPSTVFVG